MANSAAIVGAGLMGRWHAHTARRLGIDIIAVVDPDPRKCHDLAVAAKATYECRDLPDLFATCIVDAAHICTPLATHYELCRQALEGGVNVLCEKPLASDEGEVDSLYEIAARRKRRLWVVHQFPWQRGAERALQSLDRIGKLIRADFLFCSAGGEGNKGTSLDDIVADILPHPLSILPHLSLDCELADLKWNVEKDRAGELNVSTICGDTRISIAISLSARPTECTMILRGEKGSWYADFYHGYAWYESGKVSRLHKLIAPFRRSGLLLIHASANIVWRTFRRQFAYPGLDRLMSAFYFQTAEGENTPDPQHTRAIAVARDLIIADAGE